MSAHSARCVAIDKSAEAGERGQSEKAPPCPAQIDKSAQSRSSQATKPTHSARCVTIDKSAEAGERGQSEKAPPCPARIDKSAQSRSSQAAMSPHYARCVAIDKSAEAGERGQSEKASAGIFALWQPAKYATPRRQLWYHEYFAFQLYVES
jgi:hypothetical protein